MARYKTLQFPNTPEGQSNKVAALQDESKNGWRVVSETIAQGKYKGKKAFCLFHTCCPSAALLAGHKEDIINVTLMNENDHDVIHVGNRASASSPQSAPPAPNYSNESREVFSAAFLRLSKLKDQGVLNDAEFSEMKAALIAKTKAGYIETPASSTPTKQVPSHQKGVLNTQDIVAPLSNSVLGWSLGSLFVLAGVGVLFQISRYGYTVIFAALPLWAASLFLLPPARTLSFTKTGITLSRNWRIAFILLLLLVFWVLNKNAAEYITSYRLSNISAMIDSGKAQDALSQLKAWEDSQMVLTSAPLYKELRSKAESVVNKQWCEQSAISELEKLKINNDLNGLNLLNRRCGTFVTKISPAVKQLQEMHRSKIESVVTTMLKEGEVLSPISFTTLIQGQLQSTIQRPAGTYWVKAGDNNFYRIETSNIVRDSSPMIRIVSVKLETTIPTEQEIVAAEAKRVAAEAKRVAEEKERGEQRCYSIGGSMAAVYNANLSQMANVGLMASRVMEEGCRDRAGASGEQCVSQCKSGFRSEIRSAFK